LERLNFAIKMILVFPGNLEQSTGLNWIKHKLQWVTTQWDLGVTYVW